MWKSGRAIALASASIDTLREPFRLKCCPEYGKGMDHVESALRQFRVALTCFLHHKCGNERRQLTAKQVPEVQRGLLMARDHYVPTPSPCVVADYARFDVDLGFHSYSIS